VEGVRHTLQKLLSENQIKYSYMLMSGGCWGLWWCGDLFFMPIYKVVHKAPCNDFPVYNKRVLLLE